MSSQAPDLPPGGTSHAGNRIESILEHFLFAARWLVAPLYVGLAFSLVLLIWVFLEEFVEVIGHFPHIDQNEAILGALGLIDLSLTGNLILIVIFSGYENFVSKLDLEGHADRPDWMGKVDFTSLKLKLISSMVAISGISLLRVFMDISAYTREQLIGLIALHLVFVVSGVLLALMDYLASRANALKDH